MVPYNRRKLEVHFRQYGQMKSRDGKSQRREEKKKEDQKEKVSEERRSRCAKR